MAQVYLSLGSNLDAWQHIPAALDALQTRFSNVYISPIYRSRAVHVVGPDFVNLVAVMDTTLGPVPLKDWLRALEDRHDRQRIPSHYVRHTLDLDIILYDDYIINDPESSLQIPGPTLEHAFVLKPMTDIAPNLHHPVTKQSMAMLWATSAYSDAALHAIKPDQMPPSMAAFLVQTVRD